MPQRESNTCKFFGLSLQICHPSSSDRGSRKKQTIFRLIILRELHETVQGFTLQIGACCRSHSILNGGAMESIELQIFPTSPPKKKLQGLGQNARFLNEDFNNSILIQALQSIRIIYRVVEVFNSCIL